MSSSKYRILPIFNPDGRLLQSEYAMIAINSSNYISIVLKSSNSTVFVSERPTQDALIIQQKRFNLHNITSSILVSTVGIPADCSFLIKLLRNIAKNFEFENGLEPKIEFIANKISKLLQKFSQYTSVRNLGAGAFLATYEDTPKAFQILPTGKCMPVHFAVLGKNSDNGKNELIKKKKEIIAAQDSTNLLSISFDVIKDLMSKPLNSKNIEVAICDHKDNKILEENEIEEIIRKIIDEDN